MDLKKLTKVKNTKFLLISLCKGDAIHLVGV